MNYQFSIAGIQIRVEIPYELKISDSSVPFMCMPCGFGSDLVFRFWPVDTLYLPDSEGTKQGENYFYSDPDGYSVYHCTLHSDVPYVNVYWRKTDPKTIHCAYVTGSEQRLNQTQNILNLLGLETFLQMHDALLLHASFINVRGHGILFTAPSGTGKSTQADLWKEFEGADILNGDRAALRRSGERWMAWGLPYAGTSGIYRNESAPITALVVLRQAKENRIHKLSPAEALRFIYPELSIHRWDAGFVDKAVNLFLNVTDAVPIYLLECLPDRGAVQLLKNTLAEGGELL